MSICAVVIQGMDNKMRPTDNVDASTCFRISCAATSCTSEELAHNTPVVWSSRGSCDKMAASGRSCVCVLSWRELSRSGLDQLAQSDYGFPKSWSLRCRTRRYAMEALLVE
ncbi:hypothetical protein RRG08_007191 [Elysia crispata]|uniref:Uncharacterized protein n=1 Tax=Elysia crispata TaxID=231223 RepID=A0AAE1B2U4_9GAST|nr:hypothetical protein RRG08_007191 [Elysia crispata]